VTRPNDVQTFYAYTAPGEELLALFDKFGNTNRVIDIVVTSPSGAVFTQPVPTVGSGQWGFERGDLPSEEASGSRAVRRRTGACQVFCVSMGDCC